MDCIVWACSLAQTPDDELPPPVPGTSLRTDENIDEDEKDRIRAIQLDESDSEQEGSEQVEPITAEEDSDGQCEDSDAVSSYMGQWGKSLENIERLKEKQPGHSLVQRQLGLLAAEIKRVVDERKSQKERARLRVLEETKERWIALGMMREEDAHLLGSVTGPYHPNIERSRDEYFSRKKEEEQRLLERKAREYFDNEWVMEKEKELQELQRNEDADTDPDIKKAIHYMI